MYKWLSYGNIPQRNYASPGIDSSFFGRREWSFTIADDIYIRYQSFDTKEDMRQAMIKRQPHKIDIGAVFTAKPNQHTTLTPEAFKPIERELVFDIDMTDYDDIRTCCTGAEICLRCWPYMTMAIKTLQTALTEDFAFQHIFWIYSGRRGVHCWVCDPIARNLTNEARAAIVEYLSVQIGSQENSDKKLKQTFTHVHPSLSRAYRILEPMFGQYIADEEHGQGLFGKKERYVPILNTLPDDHIRVQLYELWERKDSKKTGLDRWQDVIERTTPPSSSSLEQNKSKNKKINYVELEAWRYELVFTHCYPRLDANVSKTQNHLLKAPFCIHPKTGRVCIPIDPLHAEEFNPFTVPTVRMLCEEIDEYDQLHPVIKQEIENEEEEVATVPNSNNKLKKKNEENQEDESKEMKKTSLFKSVTFFEKNFLKPMETTNR
jgi:DNA primase small subunit